MKRRDDRSRIPQHGDHPAAWTPRIETQGIEGAAQSPRIVVGVDGSAASIDALRWAARHAELIGGTVESVISWQLPFYGAEYCGAEIDWAGNARETLDLAVLQALDAGSCIATRVVRGRPVDVLLQAAAGADLLVVGSRGLSALLSILSQSVSKRLIAQATCPVVVIRHCRRPKPGRWTRAPSPSGPIRADDHPPRRVDPDAAAVSLSAHERGILDQLELEFTDRRPSAVPRLTRQPGGTARRPSPLLLGLLPITLMPSMVPITTVLGAIASVTGLLLLGGALYLLCSGHDDPGPASDHDTHSTPT
jgi:nucleotide-binding universal stress UspA family protein